MSPTQPRWRSVLAVAAHCDDHLSGVDEDTLANDVATALQATDADSVIVFDVDGVTGHPDHRRATQAALAAAVRGVPVLR